MQFPVKRISLKILKITGITLGSLILLILLLPFLFPQTVTNKIQDWANGHINGKISFSGTSLSFFKRFPQLTLTLEDVTLNGSAPFQKDTLVAAKEILLGIDLSSLFERKIKIDKIGLNKAFINIQVDSSGLANYNIYKPSPAQNTAAADTGSTSLGINQIKIENSRLVYNDRSLPMKINARGVEYLGSGDLTKDVFDLKTHTEMQSVDFYYGDKPYILNKKVNADLLTKINTKSLAFVFEKNDLRINQLPVNFKGKFEFLKDGYDIDFKVNSKESELNDIFSALPAEYHKMIEQTTLKGLGVIQVSLAGKYIAHDSIMPNLSMNFKVRKGYVANKQTPEPVQNLFLNLQTNVPGLNPDSIFVNVDSIYFNIGKDYFSSVIRVKGLKQPDIYAKINTEIDLEKWDKAFGVKPFDVKGRYSLHLLAEGKYAKGVVYKGFRKVADTVITSIPKFTLTSSFRNGYFKYAKLPQAVNNISFDVSANCPDNNYKHTTFAIDNLNAEVLSNYLKGYFKLANADNFPIDAMLKAKFHMADLKTFYPVDSIDINGDLDADVKAKGSYLPAKRKFPVTVANINLRNGSIQTKHYPRPIKNIQVSTNIVSRSANLNSAKIFIKPISFEFEGQPFMLKASLKNLANLEYDIKSRGTINIGKIYQVFALKGYDVDGSIAANVMLKGKQSDAQAGHYDKLFNAGSIKVNHVAFTSELFPKPFVINQGVFSFKQDKMLFDTFVARYSRSAIALNGELSNVIDYATKPNAPLKGEFKLTSNRIIADDFMAFAGTGSSSSANHGASGVFMVPQNLDLNFIADVKKVCYEGLNLTDAKGNMSISKGSLNLKNTGFTIVGTPVVMDAAYTNVGPKKAYFDYHIKANDFDIKKAYNEIKLFRDMATTAKYAEGLVSLDYQLSGKLNSDMQPVYPSLKGGGVLSAKQIKLRGFKLLSTMGKTTGKDSIANNPDVTKVELKTKIANNIITIDRTKMRLAGFRVRLEGQVGFNKALNIKFRLGLPPLGILGIPMNITGTQDKPKIRLGNGKKENELQGESDVD